MKPRNAAIIGGTAGLLIGLLFLSDINGAPLFTCFVLGFLSYECTWAMRMIGNTKAIKTRNKIDDDKAEKKKAAAKAALNADKDGQD